MNINPKLLYRWQQAQVVAEMGSEALARAPEMRALRTTNKRLAQELDILKSHRHLLGHPADAMSCYRFIAAEQAHYPVQVRCRVLGVVPSRHYAWYQRQAAPPPEAVTCFEEAVKAVFYAHHRRYGTRCLRAEFQAQGHRVGRQRQRTALRRLGLRALQPKAYVPRTTDSTHGQRCSPNLLLEQAPPTHPIQLWVSDITYLPFASGHWVYLCTFQDSFTRQVVGWHVVATMPEELITTALRRALLAR